MSNWEGLTQPANAAICRTQLADQMRSSSVNTAKKGKTEPNETSSANAEQTEMNVKKAICLLRRGLK